MVIELKEKLWFGKYKGSRLIDVIKKDRSYISKMINEYNIILSDESISFYKNNKSKYFSDDIYVPVR